MPVESPRRLDELDGALCMVLEGAVREVAELVVPPSPVAVRAAVGAEAERRAPYAVEVSRFLQRGIAIVLSADTNSGLGERMQKCCMNFFSSLIDWRAS